MKRCLICGISGQDGGYLAKFLLEKGYEVHGTSRDAQMSSFSNLSRLAIKDRVCLTSMALNDFRSVLQTLTRIKPDEIYNLAGQTSVSLSFEQPVETLESISIGSLNLLEAIRFAGLPAKLYNAGSSECFGDTTGPANERTPFRPRSPYAVAKAAAFWQVANYREAYSLYACSGIFFNHESPLRPERFVTQKIVAGACRIAAGLQDTLNLGDLSIQRDWGWAEEYVEAMWLMLQQVEPDDFVIATGRTYSLEQFVECVFSALDLDWRIFVTYDAALRRPTELQTCSADPSKATKAFGWSASLFMPDVAARMVRSYREGMIFQSHDSCQHK